MSWDWSSPIALGLFLLMCGGTAVLIGFAVAAASGGVRLLGTTSNGRRR